MQDWVVVQQHISISLYTTALEKETVTTLIKECFSLLHEHSKQQPPTVKHVLLLARGEMP